ncbi:MAG: HAMP domain-containing sensor histidine kinase [Candidatus Omnitrophota bacterium]
MKDAKTIEQWKHDVVDFDLISAVSHEIRTPISSIKGYAAILSSGDLGKLNAEQKLRLSKVIELCDHLTSLADGLLYTSAIKMGKIKRQRELVPLSDIVAHALSILKLQIDEKQIDIELNLSKKLPHLWCEKRGLEQVLINLINNAIRFTPRQGRITIKSSITKKDYVLVDIMDTGMGIPKENLSKIFTLFYGLSNKEKSGVGLGLSIVQGIIKLHRGMIYVKSEMGKGSRFSFILPIDLRKKGPRYEP